jgi:hypothetical protein
MRLTKKLLISCLLLAAMGGAGATQVDPLDARRAGAGAENSAASGLAVYQGGGLTLNQAVEQVRRQYNGRIVSAETRVNGGRETHVIKVLTKDGKVKTVRVPGRRV